MKNLVQFLVKNAHWFLFLFFTLVSFVFLFKNNEFQKSKYLWVFEEIAGRVYSISNSVQSYLDLKPVNTELLNRIASLEMENESLKKKLGQSEDGGQSYNALSDSVQYCYVQARVINNQISGIDNYITLDKGSSDGIKPDMGIISANGIVGVVINVTPNFSRVISILNPKFRPNCKVEKNNYFGPLVWDGKDSRYTYLEELPRHVDFEIGDTVVTSGFSTIFPEGIPVGTIIDSQKNKNDNYNSLKVQLFTNFATLKEVLIVENTLKGEQLLLEGISRDE